MGSGKAPGHKEKNILQRALVLLVSLGFMVMALEFYFSNGNLKKNLVFMKQTLGKRKKRFIGSRWFYLLLLILALVALYLHVNYAPNVKVIDP